MFIRNIKKLIKENANNALLTRFISIPSFNKRPITLSGMPNFIRGLAIYSDISGFFLPRKNPKIKQGRMFTKREKMVLIKYLIKQY